MLTHVLSSPLLDDELVIDHLTQLGQMVERPAMVLVEDEASPQPGRGLATGRGGGDGQGGRGL